MANHNYKLLAVDVDGTLLDGLGKISAEDMKAIAMVRESGMQVSLSTGRTVKSCWGVIDQLSLDGYHAFFDGALVSSRDPSEEIYAVPISSAVVRKMVEFARSCDIDLELHSRTQFFAGRETWSTAARRQFFGIETVIDDLTGIWERESVIKGGLATNDSQEDAKAESLYRQFADILTFSEARTPAYPGKVFINVLAPGVSKGRALEVLASHLGVSLAEVVVVGDGTNDIPLLTTAGLAIAMGSAPAEVKAVADYVTLDIDHSGLAAAINKFLL
ncbi:Cof-type HAD-IIB family hydrolase [Chloroflexota bacterium]